MGKYTIRDVQFEVHVPLELDPQRNFDISGDTFAELKQAGIDLQKQIAEEFGVKIDDVKYKRDKLQTNRFVIF